MQSTVHYGYLFLPLDTENISDTVRDTVVQLSGVPFVDGPRFTDIQQCGEW